MSAKMISVRERTYTRLRRVKELLGAKSLGDAIDRLIDIYLETRRVRLRELVRSAKLREEEVDEIEEVVKRIEERDWW